MSIRCIHFFIRRVIQINSLPIIEVYSTALVLTYLVFTPTNVFPRVSVNIIIILCGGNVEHYNTWLGTERSFQKATFTTASHRLITNRLLPPLLVILVSVFLTLLNHIYVLFYIFDFARRRLIIWFHNSPRKKGHVSSAGAQ